MSSKTHKNAGKGQNKTFASKRTMNPPNQGNAPNQGGSHQPNTGEEKAFQHQDPERQFGNFEERGKHARTGDRGQ